jgi:hypothetical protein
MANMEMEKNDGGARTGTTLNIILGLWLIIAPFVLGFNSMMGAMWNSIIFGVIVLALAVVGEYNVSETWSRWINAVIGLWIVVSPFFMGFASDAGLMWNNIIVGLLIIIFSGWSISMASRGSRMMTT